MREIAAKTKTMKPKVAAPIKLGRNPKTPLGGLLNGSINYSPIPITLRAILLPSENIFQSIETTINIMEAIFKRIANDRTIRPRITLLKHNSIALIQSGRFNYD